MLAENDWVYPPPGPIRIVLKNGSALFENERRIQLNVNVTIAGHPVWAQEDYIAFDAPLDLSRVNYM